MSTVFRKLDSCPECDGSGTQFIELKGARILTTTTCYHCWGLRVVWRTMTRQEVLEALGPEPSHSPPPEEQAHEPR